MMVGAGCNAGRATQMYLWQCYFLPLVPQHLIVEHGDGGPRAMAPETIVEGERAVVE